MDSHHHGTDTPQVRKQLTSDACTSSSKDCNGAHRRNLRSSSAVMSCVPLSEARAQPSSVFECCRRFELVCRSEQPSLSERFALRHSGPNFSLDVSGMSADDLTTRDAMPLTPEPNQHTVCRNKAKRAIERRAVWLRGAWCAPH